MKTAILSDLTTFQLAAVPSLSNVPLDQLLIGGGILGLMVGWALARWVQCMARDEPFRFSFRCEQCGLAFSRFQQISILGMLMCRARCSECSARKHLSDGAVQILTGLLFVLFLFLFVEFSCQQTPMVRPNVMSEYLRVASHFVLISLLIAATGIDFREYLIPDCITVPGVLVAVALAVLSGDLQVAHVWIDWNQEVPGLAGPYIPDWIKLHPHWHGLAWSTAGLVAGASLTWLVRIVSRVLLGQEALGFGDVTLMAMIGSFLGWQPIVFVFLIAPLCGILISLAIRLFSGKTYVPYGPYLSAAAFIVILSWKWIWMWEYDSNPQIPGVDFSIRHLFGDWVSLLILSGAALTALIVLLGMIRIYRAIPGKQAAAEDNTE